jgi:ribosomal protein S18 acetylase RimI-like enzyme
VTNTRQPPNTAFSIRRLRADEWRAYRDLRLRALADAPDAFGSTLEIERAKPDEYWVERLSDAATSQWQLPLVAEAGTDFVGLAWGWIDPAKPDVAQVFSMWVAPQTRGQGSGLRLLEAVIAWAREAKVQHVELRVTCGNEPALGLYARAGFKSLGDSGPLRPGATVRAQDMRLAL